MHLFPRRSTIAILLLSVIAHASNAQWTTLDLNTDEFFFSVDYRSDGSVWIGAQDTLHHSLNSGTSFVKRPVEFPPGVPLLASYGAIHAFDPNTAVISGFVALGDAEVILRTTDAGVAYSIVHQQEVGLLDQILDIDFSLSPVGVAVGFNGRILRSTNSGTSWTAVNSGTTSAIWSVAHAGGNVLIAGTDDQLRRSTNGGLSWSPVAGANAMGLRYLAASGTTCFGARGSGEVYRSLDQGQTWTLMGEIPAVVEAIAAVNPTTLLISTTNGLYRSTTAGQYWEVFDLPDYQTLNAISFHDEQNGIAVGDNGYAIRTGNGGGPALPVVAILPPTGIACVGQSYNFNSSGDPAWSYTWTVDGDVVGTEPLLTQAFNTVGTYAITLEVSNGTGTTAVSTTFEVNGPAQVVPYTAVADPDTICPNGSTTITVATGEVGTSYQLWRNGTPQGTSVNGNGGPITFNVNNVSASNTYFVRAVRNSVCGSATVDVPVALVVFNASPGTTLTLATDSLCVPGSTSVILQNTLAPGYSYSCFASGWPASTPVPGTGGLLELPLPNITSASPAQYTITVRAHYTGLSCTANLPGNLLLRVFNPAFSISLMDTALVVGQSVDPNSTPGIYGQVLWDMGNGAVPPTHSGANPPPVTYGQAGTSTVVVTAILGDSVCLAQRTATITVVAPAATEDLPQCTEGAVDGALFISDMYLDRFNNVYLTGQQYAPSIEQRAFFAMKLDSTGQVIWDHRQPNELSQRSYGMGITADRDGNAYVTVYTTSLSLAVQGMVVPQANNVIKFDRNGAPLWTMSSPSLAMRGVMATPDDRIWVAGHGAWNGGYLQLASGEGIVLPAADDDPDAGSAFLLAVDPAGQLLEVNSFGRAFHPDSTATGFALDFDMGTSHPQQRYRTDPRLSLAPDGDLLLTGLMRAQRGATTYSFDAMPVVNQAALDTTVNSVHVFAARYAPGTGITEAFSVLGGGIGSLQRMELATDGSYRLCGRAREALVTGNTLHPLGGPGAEHGFVAKATANGSVQWHAEADALEPYDLAVAPDGSCHLLAAIVNTGVFPSADGSLNGLVSAGNADRVLLSYDATGQLQQVDPTATSQGEIGYRMRPDACSNLHVASVNGLSGTYSNFRPMTCSTCTDNVKMEVVATGGCAANCYSGFDPDSRDVAMDAFYLTDTQTAPAGARDLAVDLRNQGQQTVTSIVIDYRVNNGPVQSHTWTGTLPYAEVVNTVIIGSPVLGDRNHYTFQAWVRDVNGSPDGSPWNDTLSTEQVMCTTPIVGTYLLAPDGADFPSFRAASEVLMACGITGTTHIDVADGTYYDQVQLGPIEGTSPTDTVVFRSASEDTAAVSLIQKQRLVNFRGTWGFGAGSDHVSLQQLTLINRDPSFLNNPVVRLGEGCDHVNILGCHLMGLARDLGYVIQDDGRITFLRLEGNTARFAAYGYFGTGNGQLQRDSVIILRNNRFLDQSREGILAANFQSGLVVQDNIIDVDAAFLSPTIGYIGMTLGDTDSGPFIATGNFVRRGGYVPSAISSVFVVLWPGGALPGRSLIANNMFIAMDEPVDPMWQPVQITCNAPGTQADVLHNSFNTEVTLVSLAGGLDELVFRNNLVHSNERAIQMFLGDDNSTFLLDHNVYWSTNEALNGDWFRVNNQYMTLAEFTATYGYDANSQLTEALFVAADDLHLAPGNTFSCPTHPLVPRDIDGDLRPVTLTRQGADDDGFTVGMPDVARTTMHLSIRPNPAVDMAELLITNAPEGKSGQVRVLDAQGRRVLEQPIAPGAGLQRVALQGMYRLGSGTYLVQVEWDGARLMGPMVVLR